MLPDNVHWIWYQNSTRQMEMVHPIGCVNCVVPMPSVVNLTWIGLTGVYSAVGPTTQAELDEINSEEQCFGLLPRSTWAYEFQGEPEKGTVQ